MAGEQQFTPEAAKAVVGVVANPEVAVTGTTTADLILEASRTRHLTGQSEESLKVISGEVVPYTEKDVQRVLMWNLSSERDATTGEKKTPTNPNEDQRFRDSKLLTESARKFIENGSIDATLRTPLIRFLERNSPAVADVIAEMRTAGGNVDDFVDGLMKTPGFRENLRQLFIERLNPTRRLAQESTVKQLELDIANLRAQLGTEITQAQIDAARSDLDAKKAALLPHSAEMIQLEAKTARYQELTSEMSEIKRELRKFKGVGEPLATERTSLLTEKAALDPTADAARISAIDRRVGEIDKNSNYLNYSSRKAEVDEHTALVGEIAALKTTLDPIQQEINKSKEQLDILLERQKSNISPQKKAEIEAQIKKKTGELADAKTLLEAEMMKFYQEVTHMPADAMEKHLNDTFGKLKNIWKEEATKQAEKDTTEQGKLAATGIDKLTAWWKTKGKRGKFEYYKGDKGKIEDVLKEAFKPGGADNLVKFFEGQSDAALKAAIPELTDGEIAAVRSKFTNDAEFRKVQGESLAKQALADYFVAGGRLSGDLVKSLASSDFGRSLLTEARTKADQMLQVYKDQFGKGVLDKGTRFAEFLKKSWWMWGIGILVLFLILTLTK